MQRIFKSSAVTLALLLTVFCISGAAMPKAHIRALKSASRCKASQSHVSICPHKTEADAKVAAYGGDVSTSETDCGSFPLTAAERDHIERVIMTSCGGLHIYKMDMANAQVIRDRVESGQFGATIDAVLNAPHQFEKPSAEVGDTLVKDAVHAVFDLNERVTPDKLYYYMNPHFSKISNSVWQKGKRYVVTIGTGVYIHEYYQ